jgi:uncharacterized Fe-S cluster protein YjdI
VADRSHVRKDYATEEIVVHWDSARCEHSANCLRHLPEVFDNRRRPWVRPDRASADAIAAAVDTCPSRALTYTRLDGKPLGPNGVTERPAPSAEIETEGGGTPVVIALKPNGPLTVEGPVRIELARGEVIDVTDQVALCRCGGSGNKPYCDGTHKRNGFEAESW